ncbi:MAG: hypothetical protein AAF203_00700 [Pseudomonadota bacterium]
MRFTILFFSILFTLSPAQAKKDFLHHHKLQSKFQGKSHSYVGIHIEQVHSENGFLQLRASVLPHRNFPNAQLQWKLPDGFTVADGVASQNIDLIAGKEVAFEISIEGKEFKEGDQFFLFVTKPVNGENYGSSKSFVFQKNHQEVHSAQSQKVKKKPLKFIE